MDFIDVDQLFGLARIALAMLLGAVMGYEREEANKPAGLRTYMVVAGAAALIITLGDSLLIKYTIEDPNGTAIRADPFRLLEAIITGISFLGAGTIIFHRSEKTIEGLTTAASILLAAGVGTAVALEQFTLAIGVAVLALVILRVIRAVELKTGHKEKHKEKSV